jgi:L-aspartate oxidase
MAGNSLTEAVVFGRRAAIAMTNATTTQPSAPEATSMDMDSVSVRVVATTDWDRLRTAMTSGAGLVREPASLVEAQKIAEEIALAATGGLRAAATAAGLICRSALARDESRGVHFRSDTPRVKPDWDGRHVTLA